MIINISDIPVQENLFGLITIMLPVPISFFADTNTSTDTPVQSLKSTSHYYFILFHSEIIFLLIDNLKIHVNALLTKVQLDGIFFQIIRNYIVSNGSSLCQSL